MAEGQQFWDWLMATFEQYNSIVVIAIIIISTIVLRWILLIAIRRVVRGVVSGVKSKHGVQDTQALSASPLDAVRVVQRTRTLGSVLSNLVTWSLVSVALILILDRLGFSITALVASAGIIGAALAFGAQNVIKDVLNGMLMVFEDQLGVGDLVDLGPATGTVEAVGIRVTRVRDVNGTVWYVRNGEILRVGNMSQGWSRIVIDLPVSYESDVERVKQVMLDTAIALSKDTAWKRQIIDKPEIWGIETINAREVVVRLVVKTSPSARFTGARELRLRLKHALDSAGVSLALSNAMVITGDKQQSAEVKAGILQTGELNTAATATANGTAKTKPIATQPPPDADERVETKALPKIRKNTQK
ncbi:MAG: mechanosensitive ion channel family protein [Microbacteriaceae bacterium]